MSNITSYLENNLIDHSLGLANYTEPSATYLALFTTNPTMPAGTGAVEVSGGSYVRESLASPMGLASSGSSTNGTTITFPTATANWGTVVGIGIYDASSGGNLLYSAPLSASQTVNSGNTFTVPSSNLTVSLS